jgi:hypothetical protein
MRIACLIVLSLVVMGIIVGCGGTSTEQTVPNITLTSEPTLDGQVTATTAVANEDRAKIGDNTGNLGMKAVVSFNLTDPRIPAGAIIDSATLEIYQCNNVDAKAKTDTEEAVVQVMSAGNPYHPYDVADAKADKGLGAVVVESVDYGDTLTTAAYTADGTVIPGDLATVWVLGYKQIDVSNIVKTAFANRATKPHCQFRLSHFEPAKGTEPAKFIPTNSNDAEDSDSWIMGEGQGDTHNHVPGLVILYHLAP